MIFSTVVAYAAALIMNSDKSQRSPGLRRGILITAIVLNILPWLLTSGDNLWLRGFGILRKYFSMIPLLKPLPVAAAMGMAYYTSQVISYLVDCYWNNALPQINPFKLLSFICFFPQLTAGPISKYEDLKVIFEKHSFKYQNLCFGSQRILWGFYKKLVISERVGILVNSIWNDLNTYSGLWHWIALLIYPVQMYADFSGCMDIILGSAEIFDIHLAENFNNPFFSKSIREFWVRWHITLGKWAKDYVMYPVLKSSIMVKMTKKLRKKMGKAWGSFITSAIASGLVWVVMGTWHGGVKYIVGVSIYYWIFIEIGQLFELFEKKNIKLKINKERFSWRLFQCIRTYIIYAFGALFFRAKGITEAFNYINGLFQMIFSGSLNPEVLFNNSILKTGITYMDLNIVIIGIVLLIIVGILRERYGYARVWISRQGLVFRWLIWLILFTIVLIEGKYGPGFTASEFIYQRF